MQTINKIRELLLNRSSKPQQFKTPQLAAENTAGWDELAELALNDSSTVIRQQAREILQHRLNSDDWSDADLNPLWPALFHPQHSIQFAAARKLRDPEMHLKLAQHTDNPELCTFAVSNIDSIPQLRSLLETSKKHNKQKNRIVSDRLEQLKQQSKEQQSQLQKQQQLCEQAEKLAALEATNWNQDASHLLLHLSRQWQQMATASTELQQRFEAARSNCENVQAQLQQAEQQLHECVQALEKPLEMLGTDQAWSAEVCCQQIEQLQLEQQQLWLRAAQLVAPAPPVQQSWNEAQQRLSELHQAAKRMLQLQGEIDQLTAPEPVADEIDEQPRVKALKRLWKRLDWPRHLPAPKPCQELREALDREANELRQQDQARHSAESRFTRLLNQLAGQLKQQRLRTALAINTRLATMLSEAEQDQNRATRARYEKLSEKLQELLDWKDHACKPKLFELCEAMEALEQKQQDPRDRNRDIQQLRQSWRTLGYSPAREELQERFDSAQKVAFKPCIEFYARVEQKLEGNLVYVERACWMLHNCLEQLDPEYPHWPEIKSAVGEAEKVRRRLKSLPRTQQAKKVRQQYRQYYEQLFQRLEPVSALHEARKEKLIQQANKLAEAEKLTRTSTEQAKGLQKAWQQLGIGRNEAALSLQFKTALDRLFSRWKQLNNEEHGEYKSQQQSITQLIKQIEALTKLKDRELAQSASKFSELVQQCNTQLSKLPEQYRSKLLSRLGKAEQNYDHLVAGLGQRRQTQQTGLLAQLGHWCHTAATAAEAQRQQALEALRSSDFEKLLPTELSRRMQIRIVEATEKKFSGSPETRRKLCIQAEIMAAVESPPEDVSLRMKMQMQNLKNSMLTSSKDPTVLQQKFTALQADWYCGPSADPDTESLLHDRMEQTFKVLTEKIKSSAPRSTGKAGTERPRSRKKNLRRGRQRPKSR